MGNIRPSFLDISPRLCLRLISRGSGLIYIRHIDLEPILYILHNIYIISGAHEKAKGRSMQLLRD